MNYKKRDDGMWEVRLSLGFDDRGRRIQKYKQAKTKRELQVWAAKMTQAKQDGSLVKKYEVMTVRDLCEEYEERMADTIAVSTMSNRKKMMKPLAERLGKMRLDRVKLMHLVALMDELAAERNWSPGSYNTMSIQVRALFTWAHKMELIKSNPSLGLERRSDTGERRQDTWERAEVSRFIREHRDDLRAAPFIIALYTGCRMGEITYLKWSDIDSKGQLHVKRSLKDQAITNDPMNYKAPKSGKSRVVPLSPDALAYFNHVKALQKQVMLFYGYRNPHDFVTLTTNGRIWAPSYLNRHFKALCKASGHRRIRPHDLRHTHATLLLEAGVNPKVIQERLGHSNLSITLDVYSHATATMQEKAIEALDFSKSVQ